MNSPEGLLLTVLVSLKLLFDVISKRTLASLIGKLLSISYKIPLIMAFSLTL